MNLTQKAKDDNQIMKLLKVNEIHHVIAKTDKGDLTLMLRKGQTESDYQCVLDAVPCEKKATKQLLSLLF